MARLGLALIVALLALPGRAEAQRSEAALDVGHYSAGVSYARRIDSSPVSAGLGVWGAWEAATTLERNVWEPLALVAFARYRPARWGHAELGALVGRYVRADDCSAECAGTLLGIRGAALAGGRGLYIGPDLVLARASDTRHGPEIGLIWGVHGRLIIDWGR